jgi:histidinol-phosphate aminotransferase
MITGATPVPVRLGPGAVHDLAAMHAAITPATRAVLLCTPNNPTGPALPHAEVADFVDSVPEDVLVVLDEAYVEFVTRPDPLRGLAVLADRPNVVVLRTFSKAYGLAGFRVGYCVASPTVAAAVRAVALPFGVSVPAQDAVLASLAAERELMERVAELVVRRDRLADGLRKLGFTVPDAQGNFLWLPAGPRTTDYAATFGAAGLSVRPFAVGEDHDGIRITVGESEANDRVLEVAADLPR